MGVRVQVENFGDDKGVRYQLLEKSYSYATHMHQFSELFILLDGTLEITVDGRRELMTPNTAALIFPFQPHKYDSSMSNRVAIFVFSSALLPEFSIAHDGLVSDKSVFKVSDTALHAFTDRIFNAESYDIFDIKGCLYLAIQDFLKQVNLTPAQKKQNLPAEIVKYIGQHLCEEITLDGIAAKLGYSPKYLSSCIKKLFNMNFSTLIANVRVDKARHLLRESNKTRTEICYECGFGSERSFHRQFKEIMNYTPNEYRNAGFGKIKQGNIKKFQT